jgi:hypothetical protein
MMLKKEVENKSGQSMKLTLAGASEAHLLAQEIGKAGVGVILVPSRPFPGKWEQRRMYVSRHPNLSAPDSLSQSCRPSDFGRKRDFHITRSQHHRWNWNCRTVECQKYSFRRSLGTSSK